MRQWTLCERAYGLPRLELSSTCEEKPLYYILNRLLVSNRVAIYQEPFFFVQCFTPCSAAAPGWQADVTQRRGSVSPRQAGLSTKTLRFGRLMLLVAMHVCLCKPHRLR